MDQCLNCKSTNLTSFRINSYTDEYRCGDCGFKFTDDDIYDLSGKVKVDLYRQKHGNPPTREDAPSRWRDGDDELYPGEYRR